jgi:hypothetical protein
MLLRNRSDTRLRNMTDPLDEDAAGPDGDFLTVEQLAHLRQVTPAAVRAQLRAGNLAGEQVLQGQRTVWRIPMSTARRYLERAGGALPAAAAPDPRRAASGPPADPRPAAPAATPAPATSPPPASSGRVAALEAEVRRLRRQLSALADAHHRLLDAVTADVADDRLP